MARVGRIVSTTAFKLSAIFLLVFTAFALVFVFSISYAANQVFNHQVADAISSEFVDLSGEWNAGGTLSLVNAINERSRQPGASLYLLADSTGNILAGNVSEVGTEFLSRAVLQPAIVSYSSQSGEERTAMVQAVRLSGGLFLLVGRDMSERDRFGDVTRTALIVAGGLLIFLGLVSWFFVSRRVLKRIESIVVTTQQIMTGDLAGRLEVTGTNDEFDRLARSLNAMLERIELLLRGLKEVSDNIAHDLKTPLTRMRNRLEAALIRPPEADDQREVMQDTIEEADQLITTFNALLLIARVEAASLDEAMEEIDAAQAVKDVVELYEPVAEEAGMAIEFEAAEPQPFIGNRELLSQAVANLVDNAIKYGKTSDGEPASQGVRVAVRRAGDDLIITIADRGPGIPEEERGRVLERFVRLEKSRSTPGTGLGLSLVAALVKLHHGTIRFSDNAPGLVATLTLPLHGAPA